jgi:hypothetical protein
MFKFSTFIVFLILFNSCSDDFGHRLENKHLEVYFEEENQKETAKSIASFWKTNDLYGSRKQFLKIVDTKKDLHLYLIPSEIKKEIPFHERKALIELQNMLNDSLQLKKPLKIILTNSRFEPLKSTQL